MQKVFFHLCIAFFAILICLSIVWPEFLSGNKFLLNFINHELVNVLVVIVTVTAASAANINMTFKKLESQLKRPGEFSEAKNEIKSNVYWLIGLLISSLIIMIIRDALDNIMIISILNSFCLLILLFNILALIDITRTTFALSE